MKIRKSISVILAIVLILSSVFFDYGFQVNAESEYVTVVIKGSFDAETKQTILNKLNYYRKQACDEGVTLPNTEIDYNGYRKITLTSSDYVPMKWSNELERIAMQRAAECIISYSHTRPNEEDSLDAEFNGVSTGGENIAPSDILASIDAWASEKAILDKAGTDVSNVSWYSVGHYDNIVRPINTYVAVSSFTSNNRTRGVLELSSWTKSEEKVDVSSFTSMQIEIPRKDVHFDISSDSQVITTGSSLQLAYNMKYGAYIVIEPVGNVVWSSSNTDVATVSSSGVVKGLSNGTATITASVDGFSNTFDITVRQITGVSDLSAITVPSGTNPHSELPSKVTATWSDNTTSQETVAWTTEPEGYKNRDANTYNVIGKIEGYSGNVIQPINVTAATMTTVTVPTDITTDSGTPAELPTTLSVLWSNNISYNDSVTWDQPTEDDYTQTGGGQYTVNGVVSHKTVSKSTSITVHVNAAQFTGYEKLTDLSFTEGTAVSLPTKAIIDWSDGRQSQREITWTDNYNNLSVGEHTINGTVEDFSGVSHDVSVKVTILPRKLDKLEWKSGSPSGLKSFDNYDISKLSGTLVATYNNGTTKEIVLPSNDITISDYDEDSTVSSQEITFSYSENYLGTKITKSTTATISLVKKASLNILTNPSVVEYIENQNLNLNGLTAEWIYDDGTQKNLTSAELASLTVTGYNKNPDVYGDQTITIGSGALSDTFTVNVRKKRLTKVEYSSNHLPNKTVYVQGQNLDLTGLIVNGTYDNGDTEELPYSVDDVKMNARTGYLGDRWSTAEIGNHTCYLWYLDEINSVGNNKQYFGVQFDIQVVAKEVDSIAITKQPSKKSFPKNDVTFNNYGFYDGELTVTYNDNDTQVISFSDAVITGFDISKTGNQTVTVSYGGKTTTFTANVTTPVCTSISVKTNPSKLDYPIGSSINDISLDGLVLEANYNNGLSEVVPNADYSISNTTNYDSSSLGQQSIILSAYGKTTSFNVTVREKRIASISVTTPPTKTEYIPGQDLDLTGMVVKATYDNGTVATIPSANITTANIRMNVGATGNGSAYDLSTTGQKTLYVVVKEDYAGATYKSASFTVSVVPKEVQSIAIKTMPSKATYPQNSTSYNSTSFADGVLTATCNCNYTEDISFSNAGVSISGFDISQIGEQTVTVSYGGKSTTFNATVTESVLQSTTVTPPTKTSYTQGEAVSMAGAKIVKTYDNGRTEEIDLSQSADALSTAGVEVVFRDAVGNEYPVNDASITTSTGAKTLVVKYKDPVTGNVEELAMSNGAAVSVNVSQKPAPAQPSNSTASTNKSTGSTGSKSTGTTQKTSTPKSTEPKYKNEWRNGKWYGADGKSTYSGTLSWKSNSKGWWVEDSAGWYPQNQWQKIDGIWYYFKPDGYMASSEYYNGYWFNSNGSWDPQYKLSWKSNATGWWVEDISGWWPSNKWLKVDGDWYYFNGSGYMATSQYVDGYWLAANGVCQ